MQMFFLLNKFTVAFERTVFHMKEQSMVHPAHNMGSFIANILETS